MCFPYEQGRPLSLLWLSLKTGRPMPTLSLSWCVTALFWGHTYGSCSLQSKSLYYCIKIDWKSAYCSPAIVCSGALLEVLMHIVAFVWQGCPRNDPVHASCQWESLPSSYHRAWGCTENGQGWVNKLAENWFAGNLCVKVSKFKNMYCINIVTLIKRSRHGDICTNIVLPTSCHLWTVSGKAAEFLVHLISL